MSVSWGKEGGEVFLPATTTGGTGTITSGLFTPLGDLSKPVPATPEDRLAAIDNAYAVYAMTERSLARAADVIDDRLLAHTESGALSASEIARHLGLSRQEISRRIARARARRDADG